VDKAIEILLKSVKGSTETLQYIAEKTVLCILFVAKI
jgi:hypothetical protein